MKYLIAGLGNIGPEYELTRHNIGFLVCDQLADQLKINFELSRHAYYGMGKWKGRQVHLIKPTTYMNLSGKAINFWLKTLKIPKSNLLVITDDIALPFGKLRMRGKGSNGGHNGLKDIEMVLGGVDYPRIRLGIGDEFSKGRQIDYVLSRFTQKEFEALPSFIDKASEMALSFTSIGLQRTMNAFN